MFNLQKFCEDCLSIREESPVIHNITNYVAMELVANALLSAGASPIMSDASDEMVEVVSAASAIAINIGTLNQNQIKAARIAAAAAEQFGKPWVLDPVGAGFTTYRTKVAADLAFNYHPTVIRGNASEILALAVAGDDSICSNAITKGVDSNIDSSSAIDAATALSRKSGAVVSMSGPIDYITDGEVVATIENGDSIMPRITALGCTATALTAAFATVDSNPFRAALNAMAIMGVCGELAAAESSGTGSFKVRFLDILSLSVPEKIGQRVKSSVL